MRLQFLVFILVLATCTVACNTQTKQEQQQQTVLWYEMMEIHDEVMPKTSEINRMSRDLKGMKEQVPDIFESQYQRSITNLEKADEGMMTWMGEIKQLDVMRKTMSHEDIMAYLYAEKAKIKQVKKNMLGSIANAEYIKVSINQYNKD